MALLCGAATNWPLAAGAQQPKVPLIGFLSAGWPGTEGTQAAFLRGLNESGYVDGQNVAIEYRWAQGRYDHLPTLAAELARRQPAVIFAIATLPALAAKATSTTVPIVFSIGNDPIKLGLVPSFNRPGGNITGVGWLGNVLAGKQFQLLNEMVPKAGLFGLLVNPNGVDRESDLHAVQTVADALHRGLLVVKVSAEADLDDAFTTLVENHAIAVSVVPDVLLFSHRAKIVALAARHRIPAIYFEREFVDDGGLISYGADRPDAIRQAGVYVGRILKGEKPGDLPVVQPTKFDLVINLKTAKALGLTVPQILLVAADEVIE
jgi:putative ABC transport system substrate-binding protein